MTFLLWCLFWICVGGLARSIADRDPKNYQALGWVWYIEVQLIMAAFMVLGWILLIPFCLTHAWFRGTKFLVSLKDGRPIDAWRWNVLNFVYGNPEDGVSGQCALVWIKGVNSPYMPQPWKVGYTAPPAWKTWLWDVWRAYCWSAWRNSCDSLKYQFSWANGPQATILGRKVGWWDFYGLRLPVL